MITLIPHILPRGAVYLVARHGSPSAMSVPCRTVRTGGRS
jgi:hypothetical protein